MFLLSAIVTYKFTLTDPIVFNLSVQCIWTVLFLTLVRPVWLFSACHILLPQIKYLMPLTELIIALTSFTILFTCSNYSWYQLWEYWGELTCLSGAFHFLNMHSIKVHILLSKCSRVTFKCSLCCPQPVSSLLRVRNG